MIRPYAYIPIWLLISSFFLPSPCQSRVGEDFTSYKTRSLTDFLPAGQFANAQKSAMNFRYLLKLNNFETQAMPGYAVGLTITVVNGRITGQSMAISLGLRGNGLSLAIRHALAFVYESIGKKPSQDEAQIRRDHAAIEHAILQALGGAPQNIRFPGFSTNIFVSKDARGNLIIAATAAKPPASSQKT